MPRLMLLFFVFCARIAKADDIEIKYNLVGAVVPPYAEHGLEIEYSRTKALIPFLRLGLIVRDYDQESWEGETVGNSKENGFNIWIGDKARPFPWRFFQNLETLIFYRYSKTRFEHASQGWATGNGEERVSVNAVGAGLSYNINIGKWIVVEPFWYGDYGQYEVEPISGDTAPHSPYSHRWDDEHRVGLNLGIRL